VRNDENVPSKSIMPKTFLGWYLKGLTKIAGSGSGTVSQEYGSAVPDPSQNVTDPEHWNPQFFIYLNCLKLLKICVLHLKKKIFGE
jgi:hypothetical protein